MARTKSRPNKIGLAIGIALIGFVGGLFFVFLNASVARIDPENRELVVSGAEIYGEHCAACHGQNLEGQPNWREPLPTGVLPAPPHDETGHTWHHSDQFLFDYAKQGGQAMIGDRGQSNMPAFGEVLRDTEIWAVLSFIKSRWPLTVQDMHSQRN